MSAIAGSDLIAPTITLLELITVLSRQSDDDGMVVEVALDMARSGRVILVGEFRAEHLAIAGRSAFRVTH